MHAYHHRNKGTEKILLEIILKENILEINGSLKLKSIFRCYWPRGKVLGGTSGIIFLSCFACRVKIINKI